MSINDFKEKIKPFYTLILILVVSSIFFALGRLSVINERKQPLKILYSNAQNSAVAINAVQTEKVQIEGQIDSNGDVSGEVIGSKSGKKYYFPWCGTVKRINPENQIKFSSIEEAKAAGFTPGGNCKGLK